MSQPQPASSAIVCRGNRLLLVRRLNPPSQNMFAFPGGRGEPGEAPEDTALRELFEETGISARDPQLFATYDLPGRDAENHSRSQFHLSVFLVEADDEAAVQAADDAADAGWFTLEEIRGLPAPASVLECAERLLNQLHENENRGYLHANHGK